MAEQDEEYEVYLPITQWGEDWTDIPGPDRLQIRVHAGDLVGTFYIRQKPTPELITKERDHDATDDSG